MDLIRFCTQDRDHVVGTLLFVWIVFEGVKGLIEAARGPRR